jgi:hypothetical protein
MSVGTVVWAHCNTCLGLKKHTIVAEHRRDGSEVIDDHGNEIRWSNTHRLLECGGCERVCMSTRLWNSESDEVAETYYPPAVSRQKPSWVDSLPTEYTELISEVYTALHADSRALAIMGARTLVDLFITRHVGDVGGFEAKLTRLVDDGFLSTRNRDVRCRGHRGR